MEISLGNIANKSLACPGCSNSDLVAAQSDLSQTRDASSTNQSHPRDSQSHPRDNQSHLLVCDMYSDLRSDLDQDPLNDEKLAEFFINVVQRRIDNGDD